MSGHVSIETVGKIYSTADNDVIALKDCSLDIPTSEFVALVGPSGCGKSTLLNIVAGFDSLSSGQVLLDDEPLSRPEQPAQPGSDRVVVFQNGALLPWRTVLDNVTYGPVVQGKLSVKDARDKAMDLLARTGGLDSIAHDYPAQLSSGMQRRVEILRALINEPKILLLDEPFRAMDTVSKTNMHQHVLDMFEQFRSTVLFITHDLEEAIYLADSVAVMTTRPGTIRMHFRVDLPRPRTPAMTTSSEYLALKKQAMHAVHEEARKAFERGERELA